MERVIFNDVNDEFHVNKVSTIEEAPRLPEGGFRCVTVMDGSKLFRNRK